MEIPDKIKLLAQKIKSRTADDCSAEALSLLSEHPLWCYFKNVSGLDAEATIVLLANVDFSKVKYVSQIYTYCGISKSNDGGRKNYLKTVLNKQAEKFIKENSEYALYYWTKMCRILSADKYSGEIHEDLHMERIAKRYMIQKYIRDLYLCEKHISGKKPYNGAAEKGVPSSEDCTDWKQFIDPDSKKIGFMHFAYKVMIGVRKTNAELLKKSVETMEVDYEDYTIE